MDKMFSSEENDKGSIPFRYIYQVVTYFFMIFIKYYIIECMFIIDRILNNFAYEIIINDQECLNQYLNNMVIDLKSQNGTIIDFAKHNDFCSISISNMTVSQLQKIVQLYFPKSSIILHSDNNESPKQDHHNIVIMKDNPNDTTKKSSKTIAQVHNSKSNVETQAKKDKNKDISKDTKKEDNKEYQSEEQQKGDIIIHHSKIVNKLPTKIQNYFNKNLSEDEKSFGVITIKINLKTHNNVNPIKKKIYDKSLESVYGRIGKPYLFSNDNNIFFTSKKIDVNKINGEQFMLCTVKSGGEYTVTDINGNSTKVNAILHHSNTNKLFSKVFLQDKLLIGSLNPKFLEQLKTIAKINTNSRIDLCCVFGNKIIHHFSVKSTDLDRDIVICQNDNKEFLNELLIQLEYPLSNDIKIKDLFNNDITNNNYLRSPISIITMINFIILLMIVIYLVIRRRKWSIVAIIPLALINPSIALFLILADMIICNPILRVIISTIIAPIVYRFLLSNQETLYLGLYTKYIIGFAIIWEIIKLVFNKMCHCCQSSYCSDSNICNNNK